MKKYVLALAAILPLLSTLAQAAAFGKLGTEEKLTPGIESPAASAFTGDTYADQPVDDRQRLAGDEEDVAKDKDALARDREAYRWWLLNDDKRHLEDDQARLREDYDSYAHDAGENAGAAGDLGAIRSHE